MNTNAMVTDLESVFPSQSVELLSEGELRTIEGGLVFMPALYLIAGGGAAAIAGAAAGLAVYYFTR